MHLIRTLSTALASLAVGFLPRQPRFMDRPHVEGFSRIGRLLAVAFQGPFDDQLEEFSESKWATMNQIYEDVGGFRSMIFNLWPRTRLPQGTHGLYQQLNLDRFSLYVDHSGMPAADRERLKDRTRYLGSRIGRNCRVLGWKGSDGFHGEEFFSCWEPLELDVPSMTRNALLNVYAS